MRIFFVKSFKAVGMIVLLLVVVAAFAVVMLGVPLLWQE
jgi:hypothetical protein